MWNKIVKCDDTKTNITSRPLSHHPLRVPGREPEGILGCLGEHELMLGLSLDRMPTTHADRPLLPRPHSQPEGGSSGHRGIHRRAAFQGHQSTQGLKAVSLSTDNTFP